MLKFRTLTSASWLHRGHGGYDENNQKTSNEANGINGFQSMSEQQIIELEIKAAHQEDLLQELNKIVAQQQQQIDRLEKTCQLLHERMNSFRLEISDEAFDPPPPHY